MTSALFGYTHNFVRMLRSRSGVALTEFALVMPVLMAVTGGGVELAHYTVVTRKISDMAGLVADNASRVGDRNELSVTQLREVDINDVLEGAQVDGAGLEILKKGRIILSSLQMNEDGGQWIMWQRCRGAKAHGSSFGTEGAGNKGTSFPGMGPASARVKATASTAVMFVEIAYTYEPIVPFGLITKNDIVQTSSFAVRDNRDLTQVFNPSPAAPVSRCS